MTIPSPELPVGMRFVVRGNAIAAGGADVGFLGSPSTGRSLEPVVPVAQQVRPEGRPGVRHHWPSEYPERARELHATGLSCPKVAERLGVPFATTKMWLWPESQKRAKEKARSKSAEIDYGRALSGGSACPRS